jgi:uncharacterized protein YbjT (DUF2867 family)
MSKIAVAGATGRVGRPTVDVLEAAGHEVVRMSRATGVDLATGEGLADALVGAEAIVDAATWPTPDGEAATEFFVTAARNLHAAGEAAGVRRIVVVSIIGIDKFADGGYNGAKLAHERAHEAGPIPVSILRASQFHEFVETMMSWGTQGDVVRVPPMRTQLVAAGTVAEALATLATAPDVPALGEIAGPRSERLAEMATLVAARNGNGLRIEEVDDPSNPDGALYASGALLPNPGATLAGPTFEEWLAQTT